MLTIAKNLAAVRDRIAAACAKSGRSPDEVTLVAVSKRQPDESLAAAYEAGHRDYGENYVQELVRKRALLPADARWHLIGHLQTNKAKQVVGAHLIHTVDSVKVARALDKAAANIQTVQAVLLEVNLADEMSKAGLRQEDVPEVVSELESFENLRLDGLMCIPPVGDGRRYFPQLRALKDRLHAQPGIYGRDSMTHLSMGMSADYEEAIVEGATIVRVGTAIFGARPDR